MNTLIDFISKIPKGDENACWDWVGYKNVNGYGIFNVDGKPQYAHRISYEIYKGKIPKHLEIDHLCRNRACINPTHLEAVSSRENTIRGESPFGKNARKTHCPKGHPLSGRNLILRRNKNSFTRGCRICSREGWRKYNKKRTKPILSC